MQGDICSPLRYFSCYLGPSFLPLCMHAIIVGVRRMVHQWLNEYMERINGFFIVSSYKNVHIIFPTFSSIPMYNCLYPKLIICKYLQEFHM